MSNVIEGFESLSKQEIFNMAAAHVLKNGKRSSYNGACSYQGIGCAAAPFLTDSARGKLVGSWSSLFELELIPGHECAFIQRIQECHDYCDDLHFVAAFKAGMQGVAEDHNLDPSVLLSHG